LVDKKIGHLAYLSVKAQIPYELSKKIKTFIENNYESLFSMDEETEMIRMLTPSLRDELLSFIYGRIVKDIKFFRQCDDNDFLWHVLPLLKLITLRKDDVIFFRGDYADEIYFIMSGMVILFSEHNVPIQEFTDGDMFGASDTLLDLPRNAKAEAMTNLKMMYLTK
jgi:CRP-like cAMP-binding protein